jgi:metal-dependent amidase/aminoacylase/carboxypeptidase family protein
MPAGTTSSRRQPSLALLGRAGRWKRTERHVRAQIASKGVRALKECCVWGTGGSLVIIGTPGEEGGAGKVELIKRGGFEDVDLAMMVHPGPSYTLYTAGNVRTHARSFLHRC